MVNWTIPKRHKENTHRSSTIYQWATDAMDSLQKKKYRLPIMTNKYPASSATNKMPVKSHPTPIRKELSKVNAQMSMKT